MQITGENTLIDSTIEFIPYYVDIAQKYTLSYTTALIYGYLRVVRGGTVTYKGLFENIGVKKRTVTNAIKELKEKGLIN